MRLAVSNIAWDVSEDDAVAELFARHSIDAIDIAPGKYFPEPATATVQEISRVKAWWLARGIEITGMQSLLFGTTGLNVFGPPSTQRRLLSHLAAICRIGSGLGATRLVFGSPRNRDRTGLSDLQAQEVAATFFRSLGDIAHSYGVTICLEPNPPCYGSNFMIDCAETYNVVSCVDHPAIGMQFDTGALTINAEEPCMVLDKHWHACKHIHASEPGLVPLGDGSTDHGAMGSAIRKYLPEHIVSIEMVATSNESHLISIERALGVAAQYYDNRNTGSAL